MLPLPQSDGPSQGAGSSKVPPLSYYCYRYLNSHLDSIQGLGDVPYSLCEPILQQCSAEQLLAFERSSPHLKEESQSVWQSLCFRDFRRWEARYQTGEIAEPKCWRKQYFTCREDEEKRLEEVSMRIRNRREEVDQEKKERQVIVTDRLPPAKRTRFNPGPSRPKTLLEKTKAESIKMQRFVYGPSRLSPISSKVIKPRTVVQPKVVSPVRPKASSTSIRSSEPPNNTAERSDPPSTSCLPSRPAGLSGTGTTASSSLKKDPTAGLFMPKNRAYSQLPPSSTRRK
ncbi:hypothetical protein M422DRAFT_34549 [Sphaerobolus stellatus SS14]|uniref:Elongin-A n=1 Tax=Sphaerobolus stellatus (strain SS14) TaxID=990650 RepID=A0A0C9TZ85_SPHS4|nr:hypothetical protein M422DRAFT_34549 [Sphaerobolus stellatus SS14]